MTECGACGALRARGIDLPTNGGSKDDDEHYSCPACGEEWPAVRRGSVHFIFVHGPDVFDHPLDLDEM